ncbi:hypothetical protein Tsubulata_019504 [Turnera subulata]|uniref:Glucosidase II beta subunit N-terminal domain-containing protein n=1 Tax=Turnera subulata TaxID=218843 RepID=A0A9Q0FUP0_9ROSI|nr:hypothetical protein Tsubulata_019504 [Turnera subulata]
MEEKRTKLYNLKTTFFTNPVIFFFLCYQIPFTHSLSPLLGVHPLDVEYFASQVIKCKDGSNSFTRDRLNDNFCDCLDGTDEPGTSACPRGKFYCRNVGSTPRFIFSSRVNDRICVSHGLASEVPAFILNDSVQLSLSYTIHFEICEMNFVDCCDGSDEYDSGVTCANRCIMGGNLEYKFGSHISSVSTDKSTDRVISEDLFERAKGVPSLKEGDIVEEFCNRPYCSIVLIYQISILS